MYRKCEHASWVKLSGKQHRTILYEHRLARLCSQLRNPKRQQPSLALFLGSQHKREVLKNVFPADYPRRQAPGNFNIWLDSRTQGDSFPLYFAECFPEDRVDRFESTRSSCHERDSFSITWNPPEGTTLSDVVLSRLLLPFVDLICIPWSDFRSYSRVRTVLRTLVDLGHASHLPSLGGPIVLIIGEEECSSKAAKLEREPSLRNHFASIQSCVVPLRMDAQATSAVHTGMVNCLDGARASKSRHKLLFSAIHQSALFKGALRHIAKTCREPYNFVTQTKAHDELGLDFVQHIETTFATAKRNDVPTEVVGSILSTSLLVHALTPGMHVFDPKLLFENLYEQRLLIAMGRVEKNPSAAEAACHNVREQFCTFYNTLVSARTTQPHLDAATMHLQNLRNKARFWSCMDSSRTCVGCGLFSSEKVTHPCRHAICERCIRLFGRRDDRRTGASDSYVFMACIVCDENGEALIRLKPRTAGTRLLGADGGGNKVMVELINLAYIERAIGPQCAIQELFDLVIGVSAGGIMALNIFWRHCSVEQSISDFKILSRTIFSKRPERLFSRIVKTVMRDEYYDSAVFDAILQQQFGASQKVYDYNPQLRTGTRIGVVATSTRSDTSVRARVLANYNGGHRKADSWYRLQRGESMQQEIDLWMAARATAAAPGFFRSAFTKRDVLDDGCMSGVNCPVRVLVSESKIIWPKSPLDVMLSLGTCFKRFEQTPDLSSPKLSVPSPFPFRYAQALNHSMDGENIWNEYYDSLDDEKKKHSFRLSLQVKDAVPRMDDYEAIDKLASLVEADPEGLEKRETVLMALLVRSFYFELARKPKPEGGRYRCEGFIRCRSVSLLEAILRVYPHGLEFFNSETSLAAFVDKTDICAECGVYHKRVHFYAASHAETLNFCIRWNGLMQCRYLSAMPQKLSWFVETQNLDNPFDTSGEQDSTRCPLESPQPDDAPAIHPKRKTRSSTTIDICYIPTDGETRPSKKPKIEHMEIWI